MIVLKIILWLVFVTGFSLALVLAMYLMYKLMGATDEQIAEYLSSPHIF